MNAKLGSQFDHQAGCVCREKGLVVSKEAVSEVNAWCLAMASNTYLRPGEECEKHIPGSRHTRPHLSTAMVERRSTMQ